MIDRTALASKAAHTGQKLDRQIAEQAEALGVGA
jgi:hypothetical protein